MRDHQHGESALRQLLHYGQHLAHHFRIERRGRLVEEQHLGVHAQRARNRNALLLTAGQLAGLGVDIRLHAHLFQILHGVPFAFGGAAPQHLHLTEHAVFQHRQIVEQIELLKHHAHARMILRHGHFAALNILAVEEYLPCVGRFQQIDAAQKRGLAGAGRTDDAGYLALGGAEIHIAQHLMAAERLSEMTDRNYVFHRIMPPHESLWPRGCRTGNRESCSFPGHPSFSPAAAAGG